MSRDPAKKVSVLQLHQLKWGVGCGSVECDLARRKCFYRGKVPAQICFIGEGPGPSENSLGLVFCGPAGHVLDDIIAASVPEGVRYALTNLVCCQPRDEDGDRTMNPNDEQVIHCQPRLAEFVAICDPRLIVCVGDLARDWTDPAYKHGVKFHKQIPRVSIVHPSRILRSNGVDRPLYVQRAVHTIRNAVQEHVLREEV